MTHRHTCLSTGVFFYFTKGLLITMPQWSGQSENVNRIPAERRE